MEKYKFIFAGSLTFTIGFLAFMVFKDSGRQKSPVAPLPPIISKIETLEILQVAVLNGESPDAMVEMDVKNNSPKPIVAIHVESGDEKNSSGQSASGLGSESPQIVVKPYGTIKLHFPLSNVIQGLPIRINGVIYADDSEAGEKKALERMRRFNQEAKNRKS